jgi:hypothetical protein
MIADEGRRMFFPFFDHFVIKPVFYWLTKQLNIRILLKNELRSSPDV